MHGPLLPIWQRLLPLLLCGTPLRLALLLLPGNVMFLANFSNIQTLSVGLLKVVGVRPHEDQQVPHLLWRWLLMRQILFVMFSSTVFNWWQSDKIRWCLSCSGIRGSFFRSSTLCTSWDAESIVAVMLRDSNPLSAEKPAPTLNVVVAIQDCCVYSALGQKWI